VEIKAAMMETASDLGLKSEVQGAGLIQGSRLAGAVAGRSSMGLPVGNVALMLAMRLTSEQKGKLGSASGGSRYRLTSVGIWDSGKGGLVTDDAELRRVAAELDALNPPLLARAREG